MQKLGEMEPTWGSWMHIANWAARLHSSICSIILFTSTGSPPWQRFQKISRNALEILEVEKLWETAERRQDVCCKNVKELLFPQAGSWMLLADWFWIKQFEQLQAAKMRRNEAGWKPDRGCNRPSWSVLMHWPQLQARSYIKLSIIKCFPNSAAAVLSSYTAGNLFRQLDILQSWPDLTSTGSGIDGLELWRRFT